MQLVVQAGSQCGQVFQIDKDALTIGRGSSNDITFVDPAMSRVHCEIRREGDDYVVEDRHSANGTFVNDEQIELPFLLRPGDTIRLGQTVLVFQEEGRADVSANVAETSDAETAEAAEAAMAPRPWILIGSIVGIAVLILAFAFILSNRAPATSVAIAPTQTVGVVVKVSPTVAPAETVASILPTVAATSTSTVPAPTATAIATPTAAETAGAATPAATAQTKTYPIPVLSVVLPGPQSKYGANAPVPFNWIAVDVLDPDEQYRVQVSANDGFSPMACEIKTRETYVTIPGVGVTCNAQWQFGQHYYWRVHIIPRDTSYADPIASTDTAPVSEFTWGP